MALSSDMICQILGCWQGVQGSGLGPKGFPLRQVFMVPRLLLLLLLLPKAPWMSLLSFSKYLESHVLPTCLVAWLDQLTSFPTHGWESQNWGSSQPTRMWQRPEAQQSEGLPGFQYPLQATLCSSQTWGQCHPSCQAGRRRWAALPLLI